MPIAQGFGCHRIIEMRRIGNASTGFFCFNLLLELAQFAIEFSDHHVDFVDVLLFFLELKTMKTQFQIFSDDLADAYQKHADELQRRGPRGDPDLFHEYLCDICGLNAESVKAESVSILMRGEENPKLYPKGHLELVACNKGNKGAPTSVWHEL